MRIIFFIIVGIFLFFTAPIWVPIVGILGLVGAGTMVVGGIEASHAARQDVAVVTP
jgi:membrane-bound ClpP family serine protease